MQNPYKILGVKKDADENEIKKAYHSLAMKSHPDKNPDKPDAEEKFKEISAAYDVLKDPKKKSEYDQFGSVGGQNYQQYSHGFNIQDIFSSLGFDFGRSKKNTKGKGRNLKQRIALSFMDAAKGCKKDLLIEYPEGCDKCKSSGAKSDKDIVICSVCSGSGQIGYGQGSIYYMSTCSGCGGSGSIITHKCDKCNGTGQYNRKEKLKVSIPAGVGNGTAVKLSGKGMPGPMESGDLYLGVMILPHKTFTRNGLNIGSTHKINYLDAILGSKLKVDTIHGQVVLSIPSGTQPNSILKISNKGIIATNNKGHHLVVVEVNIPKNLINEEKEALEKIREIRSETIT